MTNPTNWPNPERPGVPMFPERSGRHHVGNNLLFWYSDIQKRVTANPIRGCKEAEDFAGDKYHGPVLTPTQIDELLAGERERCAKECDEKVAFTNDELKASGSHEETRYWTGEHCAATFCADAIRGLGDKA